MKKTILLPMIAALSLVTFASCELHEEPELTENGELGNDPSQIELTVDIDLNVTLPGSDNLVRPISSDYIHRFVIEAYDTDRQATNRTVIYNSDITSTSFTIPVTMKLHARKYRLIVWSDYVKADDPETPIYYDTETLTPVINNGSFKANNEAKDAFTGYTDLDLVAYAMQPGAAVTASVELKRPVGRYQIVATDIAEFQRRIADGSVKGNIFLARISYEGYLAVGYNCYDNVRKHMLRYLSYKTSLENTINTTQPTLSLGFDFVMAGFDCNLEVPVKIEIINDNIPEEVVSSTTVMLPVTGGSNTVVKGRFMTVTSDGGVNIDTGYDNNIEIDMGTLNPHR